MKRSLGALVFVVVTIVMLAVAPMSEAGWGYWSPSPCRGDIEWYRTSAGVYYWQYGYSEYTGAHLVPEASGFRAAYEARGWECGSLGAVRTNRYYSGGLWRIDFERGQLVSNYG